MRPSGGASFCEAAVQETATVELVRRVLGEVERR